MVTRKKNQGFTIIEMVIGIALLGIMMFLIIPFLFAGNAIFHESTDQSNAQQNVRTIGDFITEELRLAKSISSTEPSSIKPYYQLEIKTDGGEKQLVYKKETDTQTTTTKIGNPIKDLSFSSFLDPEKKQIIHVMIEQQEGKQQYKIEFDLLIENIDALEGMGSSNTCIFYTKHEE